MTVKQAAIDLIQRLPEEVSFEDIVEELCFRSRVDQGLKQLDDGQGVDHEEAKRRLNRWLR
jgi:hypothetical protein